MSMFQLNYKHEFENTNILMLNLLKIVMFSINEYIVVLPIRERGRCAKQFENSAASGYSAAWDFAAWHSMPHFLLLQAAHLAPLSLALCGASALVH